MICTVGPTEATVLILGESGTGKELIAGAVHQASQRREENYVRLNCAAIPEALLESERLRLLPLLGELRDNAEHAWHQRILREMGQLSDADWTARSEGRLPDPRWVRMKNSLITRLQDELANRLVDLDHIRDNLEGCLNLRVAIRID